MIEDATTDTDASEVFDVIEVLDRVDGDMEMLTKLVDLFRSERAELLAAMRRSIGSSDAPALERAAHALDGKLEKFGAVDTRQLAGALERMGHDGTLAAAPTALTVLEAHVSRLEHALLSFIRRQELLAAAAF